MLSAEQKHQIKDLVDLIMQDEDNQSRLFELALFCLCISARCVSEDSFQFVYKILIALKNIYGENVSAISNEKRKQGLTRLLQELQDLEDKKREEDREREDLEKQLKASSLKKEELQAEVKKIKEENEAMHVVLKLRGEFDELFKQYKEPATSIEELQKWIVSMQNDAKERLKIHHRCDQSIAEEMKRYSKNVERFSGLLASLSEAKRILEEVDRELKSFL